VKTYIPKYSDGRRDGNCTSMALRLIASSTTLNLSDDMVTLCILVFYFVVSIRNGPGPGVPLGTRKAGVGSEKPAGAGRNAFDSLQTAIVDRASRRHPKRREVPLGTRKLELAQQNQRAATRLSKNNHGPRAWAIHSISPSAK
jgi:hypothetical protein